MSLNSKCPIIYQTSQYDKFKYFDGNRPVNPRHVDALCESIKRDNRLAYHPIVVFNNNFILDGQHRLNAAKKLGLPIFYVEYEKEDADTGVLSDSQISAKWLVKDYLHLWISQDEKEYVKFKNLMDSYEISQHALFSLISRHKYELSRIFKDGDLKIPDSVENFVKESFDLRKNLKSKFSSTLKSMLESRDFMSALYRFWKDYFPKWKLFQERILMRWIEIPEKTNVEGYMKFFISVHDFGLTEKKRIKKSEDI